MAKKKVEEKINLDTILFKCRDILRAARNSGSFFEKRDMMLTLVFLRFIGEKFEDGVENLRQKLIKEGFDLEDEAIRAAFLDDPTFPDGTYNLPVEARWSTIINTPAPQLNVALDTALNSLATSDKKLKGCFIEGTFTPKRIQVIQFQETEYNRQQREKMIKTHDDEMFKKVHGVITLHYTVYLDKKVILLTNITPEGILEEILGDVGLEITDTMNTQFYCDCSKEKVSRALSTINKKDLDEIINDGESIEVKCQFCNKAYNFDIEELKAIREA